MAVSEGNPAAGSALQRVMLTRYSTRRRLRAMTFESIPFAREYRQVAMAQGET
jgi:hypothetical protein